MERCAQKRCYDPVNAVFVPAVRVLSAETEHRAGAHLQRFSVRGLLVKPTNLTVDLSQ